MRMDDERSADEIRARFGDGDQTALVKFGLEEGGVVEKGIVVHDVLICWLYSLCVILKNKIMDECHCSNRLCFML